MSDDSEDLSYERPIPVCANSKSIIRYCKRRGLTDIKLIHRETYGWILYGTDPTQKPEDRVSWTDKKLWPKVWVVAEECGINRGYGGVDFVQIIPDDFKEPDDASRIPVPTRNGQKA